MRRVITLILPAFALLVLFFSGQSAMAQQPKHPLLKKGREAQKADIQVLAPNGQLQLQPFNNQRTSSHSLGKVPKRHQIPFFKVDKGLHAGHNHGPDGNNKCLAAEYEQHLRDLYPQQMGTVEGFEGWLDQKIQARANRRIKEEVYTIPVIVHVIHNGEAIGTTPNIPAGQVYSQFEVLNQDFRRLNADTSNTFDEFKGFAGDAMIEFRPATVDPDGIPLEEIGIHRYNANGDEPWSIEDVDGIIKPATQWDPERYFNIWVVEFQDDQSQGIAGYATFPAQSGLPGLGAPGPVVEDGIVVQPQGFGSNFTDFGTFQLFPAYNRGRIAVHEAGHYLGLRHTWGDGGCNVDDFVDDTPAQGEPNFASPSSCGQGTNTCGAGEEGDLQDMTQNYMNYSDDACLNLFTNGQIFRMRTVLENSPRRTSLLTSNVADPPNPDGVYPSIVATIREVCQGGSLQFSERSEAGSNTTLTNWNWNFDAENLGGVAPATGEGQGPFEVVFSNPGTYTVTLEVVGANGATAIDTLIIEAASSEATGTLPLIEDFEGDFVPEDWSLLNDQIVSWQSIALGSGGSSGAAVVDNFSLNYTGRDDVQLTTPSFDLSGDTAVYLYFDVAYAPYEDSTQMFSDDLALTYSTNCGITFEEFEVFTGEELATGEGTNGFFFPSQEQWETIVVKLTDYPEIAGQSSIFFGFKNIGNFGNLLYIDNVAIDREVDAFPFLANAIDDITVVANSTPREIDLSSVFSDPDNDDDAIQISLVSNTNPSLVNASLDGKSLNLSFAAGDFGTAVLEIEAVSNGKVIKDEVLVRVLSDLDVLVNKGPFSGLGYFSALFTDSDQFADPPVENAILQGADDFIVPEGAVYEVLEVMVEGFYENGATQPSDSMVVELYASQGDSIPGELLYRGSSDLSGSLAVTDTVFVVPLDSTVSLEGGTYWLSVYAVGALQTSPWRWGESLNLSGSPHLQIDRGNLFGSDLTDWFNAVILSGRLVDKAFEVRGFVSGTIPPQAPDSLQVIPNGDALELTWADRSNNETGFRVERASASTEYVFEEIAQLAPETTTYLDADVASDDACSSFIYRVVATGDPSDSGPSNLFLGILSGEAQPFAPFTETFEDGFPPTGWEVQNAPLDGQPAPWEGVNVGAGDSDASVSINNFSFNMTHLPPIFLMLPSFNFREGQPLFLSFDVAYAPYQEQGADPSYDNLAVIYTTDCGFEVFADTILLGQDLATASGTSNLFEPANNQWKTITLNLSDLVQELGGGDIRLGFANLPTWSQAIYIDNVKMDSTQQIDPPSNLTATTLSDTEIQLRWVDNSDVEIGFSIERSLQANSGFEEVGTTAGNVILFTDRTGLEGETQYFYRVKAQGQFNDSEYSNVANATTEPTGLSDELANAITLFPNPTSNQFLLKVEGMNLQTLGVQLYNTSGVKISPSLYQMLRTGDGWEFSLGQLPKGIYLLKVVGDQGFAYKKVMLE